MCRWKNLNTLCSRTNERVTTCSDDMNVEVQVNHAGLLAATTIVGDALVTWYKRRSLAPVVTLAPPWLGIQTVQMMNR